MKTFKKYPAVIGLLMLIASVALLFTFHLISGIAAFAIVGLGQLAALAVSKHRPGVYCMPGLTEDQVEEFQDFLRSLRRDFPKWQEITEKFPNFEKLYDELHGEVRKLKKSGFSMSPTGVRWLGEVPFVSDECAKSLTSVFVLDCARLKGGLEMMVPDSGKRQHMIQLAATNLGIEVKAALTTTEIPVPTIYAPQIIELVFAYGQARQYATIFPLGSGQVKLPRLKAGEDEFGYLGAGTAGMSQAIGEKKVQAELVTFNANKAGGLIRIPYELEEDTFIPIGQFLARYIARQLAKLEDKTLFLADGSATYAGQTGVGTYCATPVNGETPYLLQLDNAKTKVTDITIDDLRNLRGKVSPAVLGNMAQSGQTSAAYYLHPTLEPLLRGFNKYPNFVVFEYINGKPYFDGWPVRWIGVGATNNGKAQANAFAAFFGDLSYWYLGERGQVRVEISKEVFFQTDELAMRALERIDVEVLGVDAMAALQLGAGN